eukprot:scaffold105688_cov32-Tisochrysis_lutea.AAC.2
MDDAGRADAYCVVYLIGPDGAKTPSEGVTSRVCYRTTKPRYGTRGLKWRGGVPNRAVSVRLTPFSISVSQIEVLTHFHSWPGPCDGMANWFIAFLASVHRWMQTLELKLPGGKIGDRGFFVNDSAASSRVRIDVYDAQVCEHVGNFKGQRNGHICWPRDGFPSSLRVLELVERPAWPPTRNVVEFAQLWATPIRPGTDGCSVLVGGGVIGYAVGAMDGWSAHEMWRIKMFGAGLIAAVVMSFLAHRVFRIEDRPIGRVEYPLKECLDQSELLVDLALQGVRRQSSFFSRVNKDGTIAFLPEHGVRNNRGTLGILRVALRYTEI